VVFGLSWGVLGRLFGVFGPSWAVPGTSLVDFWGSLGRLEATFGVSWRVFGPSWAALGGHVRKLSKDSIHLDLFWPLKWRFWRPGTTLEDTKSNVHTEKTLSENSCFRCQILIENWDVRRSLKVFERLWMSLKRLWKSMTVCDGLWRPFKARGGTRARRGPGGRGFTPLIRMGLQWNTHPGL
jgi:hypothetical protein